MLQPHWQHIVTGQGRIPWCSKDKEACLVVVKLLHRDSGCSQLAGTIQCLEMQLKLYVRAAARPSRLVVWQLHLQQNWGVKRQSGHRCEHFAIAYHVTQVTSAVDQR